MFSLICAWTNGWVNNLKAGDVRRHGAHYDVTVILLIIMLADVLAPNHGIKPSTGTVMTTKLDILCSEIPNYHYFYCPYAQMSLKNTKQFSRILIPFHLSNEVNCISKRTNLVWLYVTSRHLNIKTVLNSFLNAQVPIPNIYIYIYIQGSRGPGGKGPGPLKIQWGPCEILPEGPMDPQKLENWKYISMEGPFRFCLGPLEIQMVGAPDPQQKMSTESPDYIYINVCVCV